MGLSASSRSGATEVAAAYLFLLRAAIDTVPMSDRRHTKFEKAQATVFEDPQAIVPEHTVYYESSDAPPVQTQTRFIETALRKARGVNTIKELVTVSEQVRLVLLSTQTLLLVVADTGFRGYGLMYSARVSVEKLAAIDPAVSQHVATLSATEVMAPDWIGCRGVRVQSPWELGQLKFSKILPQ
jgi:hypothetical protein